jgi:hypothetical protein
LAFAVGLSGCSQRLSLTQIGAGADLAVESHGALQLRVGVARRSSASRRFAACRRANASSGSDPISAQRSAARWNSPAANAAASSQAAGSLLHPWQPVGRIP